MPWKTCRIQAAGANCSDGCEAGSGRNRARCTVQGEREGAVVRPLVAGENGRGDVIRTHDPLHPMQVRYQAALRPDTTLSILLASSVRSQNLADFFNNLPYFGRRERRRGTLRRADQPRRSGETAVSRGFTFQPVAGAVDGESLLVQ